MRETILYSAIRALFVAFCVVIGLCLGFLFISVLLGSLSGGTSESKLTTVNTEEILPNANGKRQALSSDAPVILQVNIKGVIGLEDLDAKTIRQQLIESREGTYKGDRVKGLLVYIDSPGGTVMDADNIYQALIDYKEKYKVPVYAYVDGLCASGGMYIASAADKIYANNVSLIGSVGVIAPTFMNFTKLLDKIGVEALTISAGKDKDALNPLRPWKPGEEENYKQIIDYYYKRFVDIVVKHRPGMSKEKLVAEYGANLFPAQEAVNLGFIDVSGASLSETLDALLKEVHITTDFYQFIRLENKSWWRSLFSNQTSLIGGKVQHQLTISPEMDLLFKNQYLYLYCPH